MTACTIAETWMQVRIARETCSNWIRECTTHKPKLFLKMEVTNRSDRKLLKENWLEIKKM